MSAVLREDQKLRRVIKVYGVEQPVVVELSHAGITFKVKGTKTPVGNTWPDLIRDGCHTEDSVKSYFAGKPLEYLIAQAAKQAKRAEKRAAKKKESNEAQV